LVKRIENSDIRTLLELMLEESKQQKEENRQIKEENRKQNEGIKQLKQEL